MGRSCWRRTASSTFPDEDLKPTGGLLAPTLGVRVHAPNRQLAPFVAFSGGPAFTGDLVRPLLQASFGIDIGLGRGVSIGPYFGYGRVIQKNGQGYTTDGSYLSVGMTLAYRPLPPAPRARGTPYPQRRARGRAHPHPHESPAPEPKTSDARAPELLDRALPPAREDRMELLAPVLFAFDSDTLEPVGVAMLHEVASLLKSGPTSSCSPSWASPTSEAPANTTFNSPPGARNVCARG